MASWIDSPQWGTHVVDGQIHDRVWRGRMYRTVAVSSQVKTNGSKVSFEPRLNVGILIRSCSSCASSDFYHKPIDRRA